MARLYKVSADTAEKEKIIGGVLTLVQGGWCALGLIVAGIIFTVIARLTKSAVLGFVFALPIGGAIIYFFAFYKIMELSLFTYLIYRHEMNKKTKYLINDLRFSAVDDEQFFY